MPLLNTADKLIFNGQTARRARLGRVQVWVIPVPAMTVAPVVTGDTGVGAVLSCSTGSWTNSPTSYAYQWQRNIAGTWTNISGATANTHTTTVEGDHRCLVTASNAIGAAESAAASNVITIADLVTVQLGDQGSNGAGNWPTSANRALMRKITFTKETTLTQFNMRLRAASTGVGDRYKGLVYAADNTGGYPGTRMAVSAPTGTSTGGAQLLTAAFANEVIPAGTYWIGYVCDGGSGSGCESDSGGTETNVAIMLNGGEVSYASPPATAGLWPGSPGPYSNVPSIWVTALQAP